MLFVRSLGDLTRRCESEMFRFFFILMKANVDDDDDHMAMVMLKKAKKTRALSLIWINLQLSICFYLFVNSLLIFALLLPSPCFTNEFDLA